MSLYLRLAWRNLWRHRRRTLIVVIAIGMSLGMMMWYDGMIAGFNDAIYGNAIKVMGGNIQVHPAGYRSEGSQNSLEALADDQAVVKAARSIPSVLAATRRITTGGLANNRKGAFGVSITAIEPEAEQAVSLIAQHVTSGSYLSASDQDMVLIGKGLADAMDVKAGDRISLSGRATHNQMRSRTMTVAGIYDLGMADIEKQTVYISLAEGQSLYGLDGKSTVVTLTLDHIGNEAEVMKSFDAALPGYEAESWQTLFPELQSALGSKNGIMNVFGVIILAIAGIGTLNLLLMAIYERTREIGVLGAFGMRPGQISTLFLLEGTMMGLVGIVAGVAFGLAINFLLNRVGMDFSSYSSLTSYMALISGKVYPSLGLENLPLRVITALVISFLSAWYPAHEAAQREPAQALHFV
jgi:ABC-type lipoprotein release transport system permease subunit